MTAQLRPSFALWIAAAACAPASPEATLRTDGLTASFQGDQATFVAQQRAFSLGSSQGAWTCAGEDCAQVERDANGVHEWWRPHAEGLEHGFELNHPAELRLPFSGVAAAVSNGQEVALFGDDGLIASYRDPRAYDATGRSLPIRLDVDDDAVVLAVDTTDASFPVRVDPVLVPAARTITGLAGDHLGGALASGGDVNHDGFGDLLVGAREAAAGAGRAWTWHGSSTGVPATAAATLTPSAGALALGAEVVGLDLNADGFGDAVVSPGGGATGALQIYLGAAGGLPTTPSSTLTLSSTSRSIAAAGDVNHDGFPDLAVTLCTLRQTLVYPGSATGLGGVALSTSGSTAGGAACSTTGAGDVNRDTFADVVVGDPSAGGTGRWMLFLGSATGLRPTPAFTANGAVAGRALGAVVVGLGDVNGDTRPDLAVTSPDPATNESTIYAYYSTGTSFSAVPSWTYNAPAGELIADADAAGDVDADGFADLVFGTQFGTTARVVHGSAAGLNITNATLLTGAAGWSTAVAGVGDLNADGWADVAVGQSGHNTDQGRVFVFHGMRDADRDGFALGVDCNDTNASIFPGATDLPADGVDQDCDGGDRCYDDDDNDGFLDASGDTRASADLDCTDAFEGAATDPTTDCDDQRVSAFPGAPEVVDDHIDQNCDGGDTCPRDDDDDGWRPDATATVPSTDLDCNDPYEAVATDPIADCNDLDSWIHPGTGEPIGDEVDQNCDGVELCYADADGDGFNPSGATIPSTTDLDCRDAGEQVSIVPQTDCDDTRASARPGAPEITGTGVDENCDGAELCYLDADGDHHRPNTTSTRASTDGDCADLGEALGTHPTDDCDDARATTYLGAPEVVGDGIDQDCNGGEQCFTDADNDGYRPLVASAVASADLDCADAFEGTAADPATDCNDAIATIHPTATEVTGDGTDQDCDGAETCFLDNDDDGVRPNATATLLSADMDCADPREALVTDLTTDCDDTNPLIMPGVFEQAGDSIDQNCDGRETCFEDDDDDGFLDTTDDYRVSTADTDCNDAFEGTLTDLRTDCNDGVAAIRPGGTEVVADGIDQDCDLGDRCWADADADGYRPNATASVASVDMDCADPGEAITAAPTTDCNDNDRFIRPAVPEISGDQIDQNCDNVENCFADLDDDGHVTALLPVRVSADLDCADAFEARDTDPRDDCNDAAATVYAGAPEIVANGVDEDCNTAELCFDDDDDDGFLDASGDTRASADLDCADAFEGTTTDAQTDCNDAIATIRPGAAEVTDDGVDQSCDGGDLCWLDNDDDGFRPNASATVASTDLDCDDAREAHAAEPTTDCDDSATSTHPGAPEIIGDEIDENCDTTELCYVDADRDTFVAPTAPTLTSANTSCHDAGEATATALRTDCDDASSAIRPNATELPADGLDQNCDGADLCYLDADDDGYRPNATGTAPSADLDCADAFEAVATDPTTDCNDASAGAHPGGVELPGDNIDSDCSGRESCYVDADNDGYRNTAQNVVSSVDADCDDSGEALAAEPGGDCDDFSAAFRPNATEIVGDSVDQDCDTHELCYADDDDDGYRPDAVTTTLSADLDCADVREASSTDPTTDCDDAQASVHPGATEIAGDQIDQTCDGAELCFDDDDDDGVLDTTGDTRVSADRDCVDAFEGTAADLRTDCDDAAATVFPGATEVVADGVDQDCDRRDRCYADADDDGFRPPGLTTVGSSDMDCADPFEATNADPATDCNDAAAAIRPSAAELPGDGVDQNCDLAESCFDDDDDDGHLDASGDVRASTDLDCDDAREGWAADPIDDCDDAVAAILPGAVELPADGVDQDCDAHELCFADADADGYASGDTMVSADLDCADAGEATAALPATDCDDGAAAVHPGTTEQAGDGVDQDCDGTELCYADADLDGFRPGVAIRVSSDGDCADAGEATTALPAGDCDDADGARSPAAPELPGDGVDQDCDGGELCYADADRDGHRTAATVASPDTACVDPGEAAASAPADDCDDTADAVHPGAVELPADSVDQDCDAAELCFTDADADGYRPDPLATTPSADLDCADAGEATSVIPTTDCDDDAATVHPGAAESVGDSVDQDCDGADACYVDNDGDGVRADGATVASVDADCADPGEAPASAPTGDCDDHNAAIAPGAIESIADGTDQDCDGGELCYVDADADGYRPGAATTPSADLDCADAGEANATVPTGDCADAASAIHPGATEGVGDGVDQDCDGAERCYADADDDGFRQSSGAVTSTDVDCADAREATAADPATDCDDTSAAVHPGATELVADGRDSDCDSRELCYVDADGDGWRGDATPVATADLTCAGAGLASVTDPAGDCRDDLAPVHPGTVERCDGIDQDCDGNTDEGTQIELWADVDGDDWGDPAALVLACAPSPGFVPDAGDCAPNDPSVHPYATDTCDGADQDCDGAIDEDAAATLWYADADHDRYGDAAVSVSACATPNGYVPDGTDCDDADGARSPGAPERCNGEDDDCDGQIDDDVVLVAWYADLDGDGYGDDASAEIVCDPPAGSVPTGGDCDDADPTRAPGQAEVCDGADNDCDAQIDEGASPTLRFTDADGDGHGAPATGVLLCAVLPGTSADALDCDDARADVYTGATETCDQADNDCDGAIDEDAVPGLWFDDADHDGWGGARSQLTCAPPPGWLPTTGDCDDTDAAIAPDATEGVGDGVDQDCDGGELCVADLDGDGSGAGTIPSDDADCGDLHELLRLAAADCDDTDAAIHTGAPERCNGLDDDCDTQVDDGLVLTAWYTDGDADSYGAIEVLACAQPPATVQRGGDCDDADASVSPDATEQIDGVDSDCDGQERCWSDLDLDGAPGAVELLSTDADCADPGEALDGAPDCDDADATVRPGAAELCNGADDDCDAQIDEDAVRTTFYADNDADGFGDAAAPVLACALPPSASPDNTDCDDADADRFPGAQDATADGVDQDCDGAELCFVDADNDGARARTATLSADADCDDAGEALEPAPADCDDADAAILPGATELAGDSRDQDCDGAELCYVDADGDGFRPDATTTVASADADCDDAGEALAALGVDDCDDADASVFPGAPETDDGRDQDCDGLGDDADSDGDGLRDLAETGCTDAHNPDTDGDGVADGAELDGLTDPCEADTDSDRLDDGDEAALGTDPTVADSDGDGLSDGAEVDLGSDPLSADSDGDGLVDGDEVDFGTNPASADSDGDGLDDAAELDLGTQPNDADSDTDGLPDGDEVDLGTDPLNDDTDGDGTPDGAEVGFGTDPLHADKGADGGCACDQSGGAPGAAALMLLWAAFRARSVRQPVRRAANVRILSGS